MLRFCFLFVAFLAAVLAVSSVFAADVTYQSGNLISAREQGRCISSARMGPPKDYLLKMARADRCKAGHLLNKQ